MDFYSFGILFWLYVNSGNPRKKKEIDKYEIEDDELVIWGWVCVQWQQGTDRLTGHKPQFDLMMMMMGDELNSKWVVLWYDIPWSRRQFYQPTKWHRWTSHNHQKPREPKTKRTKKGETISYLCFILRYIYIYIEVLQHISVW